MKRKIRETKEKSSNGKKSNSCDKCSKNAVITLPYGPHKFCEKHFTDFFEKRFRKTIRKYALFKPKENILLALSGGKDSTVLLYLLEKFFSKSNEIDAIIIDEGVKGYRNKAIKTAKENCDKLNIKYFIVSFKKEFGITNDLIMPKVMDNPKLGGTCAFCGTLRRNIMNKYAKKMRADKLATGHNLDDEVQSFVMNVFNNDFERMKRMGAGAGIIEHTGFIKRIKPLYETPEKEIIAYAAYKKINHYSEECCPYSWTAKRNEYREMLNHFENRFPGTEYSILRFYENLKKSLPKKKNETIQANKLGECKKCKEPTEKEYCKSCEMIKKLLSKKKSNQKGERKANKALTCKTTKYWN